MPAPDERARSDEHEVTPLELFFDLVFVLGCAEERGARSFKTCA